MSGRSALIVLGAVLLALAAEGCGDQVSGPLSSQSSAQATAAATSSSPAVAAPRAETLERPAASTAKPERLLSSADRSAFERVLRDAGATGTIALQRLDGSAPETAGSENSLYAWSSVKPVIVAQLLSDLAGPTRLSDEQQAQARAALTASDNQAAKALFEDLARRHGGTAGAAGAMTQVLRRAGDDVTQVSTVGRASFSPYGQTLWSVAAEAKFMSSLTRGCLLDRASTTYVLGLMNEVVPDQRWGFGTLGSVSALKGGWGPDPGGRYLVRQMGLMRTGSGSLVAFAVATRPNDGAFGSGISALDKIAAWAQGLRLGSAPSRSCR